MLKGKNLQLFTVGVVRKQ